MTTLVKQRGHDCVAAASAMAAGARLEDFRAVAGHPGKEGYSFAEAMIFLATRGKTLGIGPELSTPTFAREQSTSVTLSIPPGLREKLLQAAEGAGVDFEQYILDTLAKALEATPEELHEPEPTGWVGRDGATIPKRGDFWIPVATDKPAVLGVDGLTGQPHAVYWDGRQVFDGCFDAPRELEAYTVKHWYPLFQLAPGGMGWPQI